MSATDSDKVSDLPLAGSDGVAPTPSATESAQSTPAPTVPIGLVLGTGFKQYMQKAFWIGLTPSQEIVNQFKEAHLKAATESGIDSEIALAQQSVFDAPGVWNVKLNKMAQKAQKAKGVTVSVSPLAYFFANASRLAICNLPKEEIEICREFASALRTLPFEVIVGGGNVKPPFPLPIKNKEHKKQMGQLISFFLNSPEICDVFLFLSATKECVVFQNTLNADPEKLKTAGRIIIQKPSPEEQSTSLTVCFWCGASPLSKDVTLTKCEQCQCVCYCSEICQASDWEAEHHRECTRKEKGVHETAAFGLPSLPASDLSITRIATETSKVQRGTVQVLEGSDKMVDVTVTMCFSRTPGATIRVPMGWEVE
ncbi:hypothetical protein HDU79_003474 [Rhizoclosmatium sp. JEL0117]|nr:hypothetical protein HDU79_003474 [Rhizoclosmatium sp. JEL0117]